MIQTIKNPWLRRIAIFPALVVAIPILFVCAGLLEVGNFFRTDVSAAWRGIR